MTRQTRASALSGRCGRRCSSPRSPPSWRSTARAAPVRRERRESMSAVARHGFRLRGIGQAAGHRLRPSGADVRRAARAHHAAGRGDGRGGRRRRLRSRRLAGPLRHEQRRGQPQSPVSQQGRRHVRRCRRRRWASPTSTAPAPAFRWARCGATSTTTATRICSSTSTAGPSSFATTADGAFVRVSERAGLPAWVNANAAIWWDYDADGWLDLFLSGYWSEDIDLWHLKTTRIMPESFEYAENGGRKYVFRNRGDGTFEETSAALGIQSRRWTLAAAAADLSGTGYPDLFLANDYGVAAALRQPGRQAVRRGRARRGVGRTPKSGMNASFGDIFNDGRLVDLQDQHLRARRAGAGQRSVGAEGARRRRGLEFENLASTLGVDLGGWSWGAQFGDLNNDGTLDMYLVNGYVSAGERTSYWYDFAEIAVGHSRIIGDASNWPPMRGRSLSGYQHKRVWINDGAGRFTEVAQDVGATRHVRRPRGRAGGSVEPRRARRHRRQSARPAPRLREHGQPGPALDCVRARRHGEQSQRDRRARRSAVERPAAGAGGQRRQRLQRAESAPAALRSRHRPPTVDRVVIRWPSGRTRDDRAARRSTGCIA